MEEIPQFYQPPNPVTAGISYAMKASAETSQPTKPKAQAQDKTKPIIKRRKVIANPKQNQGPRMDDVSTVTGTTAPSLTTMESEALAALRSEFETKFAQQAAELKKLSQQSTTARPDGGSWKK